MIMGGVQVFCVCFRLTPREQAEKQELLILHWWLFFVYVCIPQVVFASVFRNSGPEMVLG